MARREVVIDRSVELYRDGELTLGKAAEIADVGIIEFKEILANLGYKRTMTTTKSDIRKADKLLKQMR